MCLDATKFVLLSFLTIITAICPKNTALECKKSTYGWQALNKNALVCSLNLSTLTGSEAFLLLMCDDNTKFVLLSVLTLVETICPQCWDSLWTGSLFGERVILSLPSPRDFFHPFPKQRACSQAMLGKNISFAQEYKESTFAWRASLKNVFA